MPHRGSQGFHLPERLRPCNVHSDSQIGKDAPSSFSKLNVRAFRVGVTFFGDSVKMALVLAALPDSHCNPYCCMTRRGFFFV